MNRQRILVFALICAFALTATAAGTSHVPKANTRSAVVAYVQEAAKIVQKSGPSCTTFATADWRSGDYYIFVVGPDDKLICYPKPEMVGKLNTSVVNVRGEKVGEMIAKMGMTGNGGWVDYHWAKPGKTTEEPKSSYVVGVKGPDGKHYVVGAGAWDLKK